MKLVANRTTRKKNNNKSELTQILHDQISMSILKNQKKSNSHQKKLKQNKLTYISLDKIWDLSLTDWVTSQQKKQKGAEFKNIFRFWAQLFSK